MYNSKSQEFVLLRCFAGKTAPYVESLRSATEMVSLAYFSKDMEFYSGSYRGKTSTRYEQLFEMCIDHLYTPSFVLALRSKKGRNSTLIMLTDVEERDS